MTAPTCIYLNCARPREAGDCACWVHRAWTKLLGDDRYRYAEKPPTAEAALAAGMLQAQPRLI